MATRNTTLRDKHRRIIAHEQPPCFHCGQPINYTAHHLDPLAFQIDHLTPINKGGDDALDNLVPSHRACNRDKGDRVDYQHGVTYVTERNWWTASA